MILRTLLSLFEDAFFPLRCVLCEKNGELLCASCAASLPRRSSQVCGFCGARETPQGTLCHECHSDNSSLDGIFAATRYDVPHIARLIHLFKYRFLRDLAEPLGHILSEAVLRSELPLPDLLLPVPLHPRRERFRGWNQSLLLAEEMRKHFPEPIAPRVDPHLLNRIRFTAPQMSLRGRIDRAQNIEGAFALSPPPENKNEPEKNAFVDARILGKYVWLIDDVAASGATLRACADVLKKSGAKKVFGVVVAR